MQHRMGTEIFTQPAVEGRERMRGCEAFFEQQPHRVAFVAERRLHADEHVAEAFAEDKDAAAITLLAAGRRAPLGFDFLQVFFTSNVVVCGDAHMHVGLRAVAQRVAVDDAFAKVVHAVRHLDRVALALHGRHGVEQRLEHRQEGGGAGVAGVRREVEDHGGDLALGALRAAQVDQLAHARGQQVGALDATVHVVAVHHILEGAGMRAAGAGDVLGAATPAEHHRAGGAVELGDRDHHGRLDRQQPARRAAPLVERLELDRGHGEIGHVEFGQDVFGRLRVVVGRATDQRKTGQRNDGVDGRPAVIEEERVDRGARVEAGCKARHHPQTARFHGGDHAVVVVGIAGQQVRPHQQQADAAALAGGGHAGQVGELGGHAGRHARVVDAELGVFNRRLRLDDAAQHLARAVGIAVDQELHHVRDVRFRARQPVLQGQEIGAHVLRGARDEAQDLRQPAQHLHLLRTGGGFDARFVALGFGLATQALEHRHRPSGRRAHVELAHAGELHHLGGRHGADHRIAMVAARFQRRQHRQEMFFHEQHGGDDDVATGDVGVAAVERRLVVAELGSGMHDKFQPGHGLGQRAVGALGGAGQMAVHGHDDHPHRVDRWQASG